MADVALKKELGREEAAAIRVMLAEPLLDATANQDGFRLVVGCRTRLQQWFEAACGWRLEVDVPGGFARLFKRTGDPDATRPALRTRGAQSPFDRRRYELLCLLCAELSSHPVITIGLLAQGIASATAGYPTRRFDSARKRERAAFVDALRHLQSWGIVTFSSDVDAFIDSEQANAIISASTSRLHHLLASETPASTIDTGDTAATVATLTRERRYGDAPLSAADVEPEQKNRWLRHSLGRALLDDPAVYYDELSGDQRSYATGPTGRRWLRERASEAGFDLETRTEGFLAIDPERLATDMAFPDAGGNVKQAALLLIDHFVTAVAEGRRQLTERSMTEVIAAVRDMLAQHSGWAQGYRDEQGAARLADDAVEQLVQFRLVQRVPASESASARVRPLPAIARYVSAPARVKRPRGAQELPFLAQEES